MKTQKKTKPTTAPTGPIRLDWPEAAKRAGFSGSEGEDLFKEIRAVYLANVPEAVGSLSSQVQKGEAEGIQLAAHKLKGMSENLGAFKLATLCRDLEAQTQEKVTANAQALCLEIEQELEALKELLAKGLQKS